MTYIAFAVINKYYNTLAQAIEGPAQCLYNNTFDDPHPYCRMDGHREICYGQICRRYDPKNEGGKVAFCCRSVHKHHIREHCCNEQEFCKEHEWDVNNCPNWLVYSRGYESLFFI